MKSPVYLVAVALALAVLPLPTASAQEGSARREIAQSASAAPSPARTEPQTFSAFSARGGQAVARPPQPESTILEETSTGSPSQLVPPGVHLSPLAPILGKEALPEAEKAGPKRRREAEAAKGTGERASASRRRGGQCTEILQRATVGELSREDVEILRTQCR